MKDKQHSLVANLEAYHLHIQCIYLRLEPLTVDISHPEHAKLCLPSTSAHFQSILSPDFKKWETDCQIGYGHDILEKIHQALGMKSFIVRHHHTNSCGYKAVGKGHTATQRAEKKVYELAHLYRNNWQALQVLAPEQMFGLQELNTQDLKILSSWREEDCYQQQTSDGTDLPWIWTINPSQQSMESAGVGLKDWELEGMLGSHCLLFHIF